MILIIAISTFVCISLGMLGIYWLVYKPQSAATERLRRLAGRDGGTTAEAPSVIIPDDRPAAELAQRLASPLNKLLPPSATEARAIQKKLMHAGYRSPEAPIIYRGIQLAAMAGLPFLTLLVNSWLANPFNTVVISMIIAFLVGFFVPRFILNRTITNRQR